METRQRSPAQRFARLAVVLGLLGSAFVGVPAAHAGQGTGNPILTVNPASVAASGPTTVQVQGRDYLVPPHAEGSSVPGGVYLFFGYVEGTNWGPSSRAGGGTQGQFGGTYFYPGSGGNAMTRGNGNGSVAMIAYSAAGSGGETPHHMDRNGNWTAPLTIPGPTFSTTLPNGQTRNFDCRQVTCGVFTIGAMGNVSATNEKFTPISFNGASTGMAPNQMPMGSAPMGGYPPVQQPYPQQPYPPQPYPQQFPQQQYAAPPPQAYAPPVQQPAPQQQAAPAPVTTPAPTSAPSARTSTPTPEAAQAVDEPDVDETTIASGLVPQEPVQNSKLAKGELVAGTFGDGSDSGGGSPLLLGFAVLAGAGLAVSVIRILANGNLGRTNSGSRPTP